MRHRLLLGGVRLQKNTNSTTASSNSPTSDSDDTGNENPLPFVAARKKQRRQNSKTSKNKNTNNSSNNNTTTSTHRKNAMETIDNESVTEINHSTDDGAMVCDSESSESESELDGAFYPKLRDDDEW
jgi:hypothetical protein